MFKTILVGCDGSDGSLAAIEVAARLARPGSGRLVLVSVYPEPPALAGVVVPDDHLERVREEAEEILRLSAKRVADLEVEQLTLVHRSIAGGLNDAAEQVAADLIVLGPSHLHSVGRLAGQMTVQRLLHGAPCAVAVAARRPQEADADATIVVAYDGSPEADHALAAAYEIAAAAGAPVELVYAIEPVTYMGPYIAAIDPETQLRMEQYGQSVVDGAAATAPDAVAVGTHVCWGAPADAVLEVAGTSAALVVAGSRGYGVLRRAIAGSVSGALLTQDRVPVLVTPRER